SQPWLIQRAALPPSFASITCLPSEREKKNVWLGSSGSDGGRSSHSFHVIRSPRYSMTRSPALILRAAYTPRPWMREVLTTTFGWRRRVVLVADGRRASRALLDIVLRSGRRLERRAVSQKTRRQRLTDQAAEAACAATGSASSRASMFNARR